MNEECDEVVDAVNEVMAVVNKIPKDEHRGRVLLSIAGIYIVESMMNGTSATQIFNLLRRRVRGIKDDIANGDVNLG